MSQSFVEDVTSHVSRAIERNQPVRHGTLTDLDPVTVTLSGSSIELTADDELRVSSEARAILRRKDADVGDECVVIRRHHGEDIFWFLQTIVVEEDEDSSADASDVLELKSRSARPDAQDGVGQLYVLNGVLEYMSPDGTHKAL